MRPIGCLQDEDQAQRFGDFLYAQGIECQVDPDSHGSWELWVLDDANVETAKQMLEDFRRHPDDPRYAQTARTGVQKKEDEEAQIGKRPRMIDGRTIFYSPPVPIGILTIILIVISVAVTLIADLDKKSPLGQMLKITQSQTYFSGERGLPEIRHGQVWRLFTPMFLHFDFLHIFFNMLWLRDLGSMIEARKSSWRLLALVLVLAGTSNVGQYLVSGPNFGGMSGVVYGLLGYIWMQGRFNPASQLSLEPQTVTLMIVWFFLCLSGLMGPIANTAHAVGLGLGVVWGFLAAQISVAMRRG